MTQKLDKNDDKKEPDADEHPTREGQTGKSTPVKKPKGKKPSTPPGDDLSD